MNENKIERINEQHKAMLYAHLLEDGREEDVPVRLASPFKLPDKKERKNKSKTRRDGINITVKRSVGSLDTTYLSQEA